MPVHIRKNKDGSYTVSTPHGVKAKHTTKKKAEAQRRLLNAIEHTSWKPTGKPARKGYGVGKKKRKKKCKKRKKK